MREGIVLTIELINPVQEDEKDGDVDVRVRIKPNNAYRNFKINGNIISNEESSFLANYKKYKQVDITGKETQLVTEFRSTCSSLGVAPKYLLKEYLSRGTFEYDLVLLNEAAGLCNNNDDMLKGLTNLRPKKEELKAFLPDLKNYKMQFRRESFNPNLRLAFFDNPACIFNSINWQHILGKHSTQYFDFDGKHMGGEGGVNMFHDNLNQEGIAELMDKVLEQLLINGFDFNAWVGSGETKEVSVGQYTLHIGVKGVETGYQIGQFYPSQGPTVTKFRSNLLEFLKKLLNR